MNNNMKVKLLDLKTGLTEYDDVKFIRIKSKDYNLLIMKDYLPIIGEIDGDIKIDLINENIVINNIKGFYINKKNQFNLFIKEKEEEENV